jgi:transcriptional regulator with XRE-family HTH domain
MPSLKTVLATNIRTRRKSMGLTQENLAELANTAPTYITLIESEHRTPSFKMIERIADALVVEATDLFSLKGFPSESSPILHDELLKKFDKYIRAAVREAKEG